MAITWAAVTTQIIGATWPPPPLGMIWFQMETLKDFQKDDFTYAILFQAILKKSGERGRKSTEYPF